MRIFISSLILVILMTVFCGCSVNGTSPLSPVLDDQTTVLTPETERYAQQSQTRLWGFFDIFFDMDSKSIEVIPNRSVGFAANVVQFLNGDPLGLAIDFNGSMSGPGYFDLDMDVTINHPLEQQSFDGYDVRGIFIGNGSDEMRYGSDIRYPVTDVDQVLLNADGYTRWYNPSEFLIPGLFGYTPGNLASPDYVGSACVNPYKYFGHGIGIKQDVWDYLESYGDAGGYFEAGTGITRNYVLRFPIPFPGAQYNYAVVANWEGTEPDDHPSHAEEAVAVRIEDNSTLYWVDDTDNGGDLVLDISIYDWHASLSAGVMEDYSIFIESSIFSTLYTLSPSEMAPIVDGPYWNTYHTEIPADYVVSTAAGEFWVVVEDADSDYSNPMGVPNDAESPLAAFFRFDVDVSSIEPLWIDVSSPNGGELYEGGESMVIEWTAHSEIANVGIGLSLNSGDTYSYIITQSTPNEGSFTWDPIPESAIGDMCRIAVWDATNMDLADESDADFSITGAWINVTSPNGGEQWASYLIREITWESSEPGGLVHIEYSKDDFLSDINVLALGTPNDGSFMWDRVPLDFSDTVLIRIFSVDPAMLDTSDDYFRICEPAPLIDLVVPNGGEQWHAGSSEDITWVSYGIEGNVNIHWSPDNFASEVYELALDETNDHIFTWDPVPYTPDEFIRIRIESIDDPLMFDISSNDFSIVEGGWAASWGTSSYDEAEGVAVDSDGYAYVCGDVNYDDTEGNAFLRKYDLAGMLVWSIRWGGDDVSAEDTAWHDGYVYVVGYFRGTDIDFDPGPAMILHTSEGQTDCYLSKFDSDGNYQWSVAWGGTDYEWRDSVEVTTSGVYVSGDFNSASVDFDPDPVDTDIHNNLGFYDSFLSVFDSTGDHVRTCTWGGTSWDGVSDVAVDDAAGRIYLVGYFEDTTDFDPDPVDTVNRTSAGLGDAYLLLLDDTFDFLDVCTWGGTLYDGAYSVGTVSLGNIYVAGGFCGTDIDLDPGVGESLHTSNGDRDVYLTCFDQSMNWQWSNTWGNAIYEDVNSIAVDPVGNVIAVGYFDDDDTDFDPGSGTDIHVNNGEGDAYWSKFDSSGDFIMAQTWGGAEYEEPYDIALTQTGSFYICGYFVSSGVEAAPVGEPCFEDSSLLYNLGSDDCFIMKYLSDGCW